MRLTSLSAIVLSTTLAAGAAAAAERAQISQDLKWRLTDLFPSVAAWRAARADADRELAGLARFRGHLGDSARALRDALAAIDSVHLHVDRLGAYAMQRFDEDTRVGESLELKQSAEKLRVDLDSALAWVRPELLAIDPARIHDFVAREPALREHAFFLENVLRARPHTLSPAEEKLVAEAYSFADTGESIHSIFTNAELPYPEIVLSSGEKVRLDAAAYTRYRAAKSRADREAVFHAFWGTYKGFTRTLAAALYAQVKAHVFDARAHHFGSALEAALFDDNVPTSVYTGLIADAHRGLPTLHRYLELRKRMMGLSDLRYSDLYAPIVKDVDLAYTPAQGKQMTLDAVAPLGKDYQAALAHGFREGWVDFMATPGKRSGAYSNGVYGVHPFQLLNFMGQYEDVSTLAHESGHSMHSYLANAKQPYATSDYSLFVAEVASTLNENLLLHRTLAETKDDATRLYLLGSYLDNLRGTLFRQASFAEFELRIHELVEKGQTLTADVLDDLYLSILREYYGEKQGVCHVDDLYGVEWAYIPHFYYDFYVYKYATSVVASLSLASHILDGARRGDTRPRDAYLAMLSAGGSKYPIDELKDAGVDMTTSAPFTAAMGEMNRIMDQMEAILARMPATKAAAR